MSGDLKTITELETVRGSRVALGCQVSVAPQLEEKMTVSWRRADGTPLTSATGGEGNIALLPDHTLGEPK